MASKQWKALERVTAKKLKGIRKMSRSLHRGVSDSDVAHPLFEIDCKYGKQVPDKHSELIKKYGKLNILNFLGTNYNIATLDTFADILSGESVPYTVKVQYQPLRSYITWLNEIKRKYWQPRQLMPLVVTKRPKEQMEVVFFEAVVVPMKSVFWSPDQVFSVTEISERYVESIRVWVALGAYDRSGLNLDTLPYYRMNGEVVDGTGRQWRN